MIGPNDSNSNYVPAQVLVPQIITTIREVNVRIDDLVRLLASNDLTEEARVKYKRKLDMALDTKYKLIYSINDLHHEIKKVFFDDAEIVALLGSEFYSRLVDRKKPSDAISTNTLITQ